VGKIGLYEGQEPAKLARAFAATFQLRKEFEEAICELIAKEFRTFAEKKRSKEEE